MIKTIIFTSQFKRDIKKIIKQGRDYQELDFVVERLVSNKSLTKKYREHSLSGRWSGYMECHIRPDWLLIYKTDEVSVILYRTGSHSDLFR